MTYLESVSIGGNLTIWFVVKQRVPKHEGEIGVRVQRILVSVLFDICLDAVDTPGFGYELGKLYDSKMYRVRFRGIREIPHSTQATLFYPPES